MFIWTAEYMWNIITLYYTIFPIDLMASLQLKKGEENIGWRHCHYGRLGDINTLLGGMACESVPPRCNWVFCIYMARMRKGLRAEPTQLFLPLLQPSWLPFLHHYRRLSLMDEGRGGGEKHWVGR